MSKKLLVLSDSHGHVAPLAAALAWAKGVAPDAAVFLGDGLGDIDRAAARAGFSCAWHKVRGNNDIGFPCQEAEAFEFGGRRFFICHGHRYSLYGGTDMLAAAARGRGADAALFGHTHVPLVADAGGLLLLNPGSVGIPRSSLGATFAVVECAPGEPLRAEVYGIDPAGGVSPVPRQPSGRL